MTDINEITRQIKADSFRMGTLSGDIRNQALTSIAKMLQDHGDMIFAANKADLENAVSVGLAAPIVKRLKFDEQKLADVCQRDSEPDRAEGPSPEQAA
jgi:glutamate-5-semialdehyde dehydrogenase